MKGYRDEITRLFWAMARAANLPSYMMRVSDRDEYFFQPTVPNPGQLTSEIAIVVLGDKEIFLDPGTPLCPFGHLAWQHNSTKGMRQEPDGSILLAITPLANYKDAISKRVGHITISDDGSAKGKIGIAWVGEDALIRRLRALRTDDAGRKKELEDELRALLPQGTSVQLDKVTGSGRTVKQNLPPISALTSRLTPAARESVCLYLQICSRRALPSPLPRVSVSSQFILITPITTWMTRRSRCLRRST